MKIALVTKGDKQFGTGHIVRCSRILDELLASKLNPVLFVAMPNEYSSLISDINLVSMLPNFQVNNVRIAFENNNFDTIIYDALTPDLEILHELELHCKRLVILDWQYSVADLSRLNNTTIIINGITGELWPANEFQMFNNVKHYQGAKYAVLNPNIDSIFKSKITNKTKSILVFMGGSDPNNWTQMLINNFHTIFETAILQSIDIQFVIGNYSNSLELHPLVDKINCNCKTSDISIVQSPSNFLERLCNSIAIITCGGITMFEAVAMGVYPIALPQVEVQLPACVQFADRGIATLITDRLVFDVDRLASAVQHFVDNQLFDENLQQKLVSALDSKGIERIIEIIESSSRF